jgi:hypothetical protein
MSSHMQQIDFPRPVGSGLIKRLASAEPAAQLA